MGLGILAVQFEMPAQHDRRGAIVAGLKRGPAGLEAEILMDRLQADCASERGQRGVGFADPVEPDAEIKIGPPVIGVGPCCIDEAGNGRLCVAGAELAQAVARQLVGFR